MTLAPHDLGIVADDLTGACDVAACFASQFGSVSVLLSPDYALSIGLDLQVINTQTRVKDQTSARQLLSHVGSFLRSKRIVFKKIDAGLRGPVGAELVGLLDGVKNSGKEWTLIVAPAIPSIGRTTRNGRQFDHGVPIDQGALANDPGSPMTCSDVRQLIMETGGIDCVVADAESAEDLALIVDTNLDKGHIIFVGSLGLALALAGRFTANASSVETGSPARRPVLICGSGHPLAYKQIEKAEQAGFRVVIFNSARLQFTNPDGANADGPLIVQIREPYPSSHTHSPEAILESFVGATASLLEKIKPDGLGIIGGETAYNVLRCVRAQRLEVFKRNAEVIAFSRIHGGEMDGIRFVSKGGSVGPDDAACQMLALLAS